MIPGSKDCTQIRVRWPTLKVDTPNVQVSFSDEAAVLVDRPHSRENESDLKPKAPPGPLRLWRGFSWTCMLNLRLL